MVSILTAQQLDAAVALAHRLNIQPQYACKACPQGKKALKDSFQTVLSHPHDRLLGILDGDQLCAVLALMAEPEERYAELVGGVFTEDSALWLPFFDYLRQHYMGVRLDACYPETNKTAIACMQKLGARLIDASDEYLLSSFSEMKPFVAQPVMAGDFAEFSAFHDRLQPGVYWTGARLADAPDKFAVYAVREADSSFAAAAVVSTLGKAMEELYFIDAPCMDAPQTRAAVAAALRHAVDQGARSVMALSPQGDAAQAALLTGLGFCKTGTALTYQMTL